MPKLSDLREKKVEQKTKTDKKDATNEKDIEKKAVERVKKLETMLEIGEIQDRDLISAYHNKITKTDHNKLFTELKNDLKDFDFESNWLVLDNDNNEINIVKCINGEDIHFYNLTELEKKYSDPANSCFLIETLLYKLFSKEKNKKKKKKQKTRIKNKCLI